MGRFPLVTAHSGCMGSLPNSREHIRKALAEGSDVIELDIRLSGDSHVVLSHDDSIFLRNGEKILISGCDSNGLAEAARAGDGELLALELAFDLLAGTNCVLNLDVKESNAALAAAGIAKLRGMEDSIFFSGIGMGRLGFMLEYLPDFRCLFNADEILEVADCGNDAIRKACALIREYRCCGLNLDWRTATCELMEYARKRSVPVHLWTVDEETDIRKVLSLGPYSLTTNRPDILRRIMASSK